MELFPSGMVHFIQLSALMFNIYGVFLYPKNRLFKIDKKCKILNQKKDDPDQRFGRITRRLTFDNLYVSKEDVLKNDNPIGSPNGPDIKVSTRFLTTLVHLRTLPALQDLSFIKILVRSKSLLLQ